MKLKAHKVGLACGLTWGVFLALLTILAIYITGYGQAFFEIMISIYPGYEISWTGALLGLVYGFIDAYCGGAILALVYNWIDGE